MSVDFPAITELQRAADQCVKCAVCLPHCPTYALNHEEVESPRGRITLLQGVVHGRLAPTAEVHEHLDSCLNCGRCEQVCPANVPYARLIDGARLHMNQADDPQTLPRSINRATESAQARSPAPRSDVVSCSNQPSTLRRLSARLLESPTLLAALHRTALVARAIKLQRLLGKTRAGRLLRYVPDRQHPISEPDEGRPVRSPETGNAQPQLPRQALLFTGCLSDSFEAQTTSSTLLLAAAYGIQLSPTSSELCCGALYQHQGDARALVLARNALQAIDKSHGSDGHQLTEASAQATFPDRPIVALQSGCGRGLKDGLRLLPDTGANAVANRLVDVFDLLDDSTARPAFRRSTDRTALYAPCSFGQTTARCLRVIARDMHPIDQITRGHGCCGAAGDHMLSNPERADRLAQPIIEHIISSGYTHILTPNAGCAWHLRANLHARGADVVVEHPAVWMARHLIH